MSAGLISIIGPPGAGKTTLAELLAERLPAELIREDYAGNPFLPDAYAGLKEARLPGQLYFLLSRLAQLRGANWPARGLFVSDYGFCQDRLFARVHLSSDEMTVYDQVARRVEGLVQAPDVLIHLDAAEETLLERITHRGRGFEAAITREFLSAMRQAYNEAAAVADCPVIRLDGEREDFRGGRLLEKLMARIRERL